MGYCFMDKDNGFLFRVQRMGLCVTNKSIADRHCPLLALFLNYRVDPQSSPVAQMQYKKIKKKFGQVHSHST